MMSQLTWSALLLTTLAAWVACLIRYPARRKTAGLPAHPPEGYLFGDPESPTRAEREGMLESSAT
jgi:hypothetical protein